MNRIIPIIFSIATNFKYLQRRTITTCYRKFQVQFRTNRDEIVSVKEPIIHQWHNVSIHITIQRHISLPTHIFIINGSQSYLFSNRLHFYICIITRTIESKRSRFFVNSIVQTNADRNSCLCCIFIMRYRITIFFILNSYKFTTCDLYCKVVRTK